MSEYNLEILTFIMFGMVTFSAVFYNGLSLVQKMMLVYMFLFTSMNGKKHVFQEDLQN